MGKRQRTNHQVKKMLKKMHGKVVERLFENPTELGISETNLVLKLKEPKEKGKEIGDLIFVEDKEERTVIHLFEVKVGLRQVKKGIWQLKLSRKFFEKNWRRWLLRKLKVKIKKGKPVYLITCLLLCSFLAGVKDWIVRKDTYFLGKFIFYL